MPSFHTDSCALGYDMAPLRGSGTIACKKGSFSAVRGPGKAEPFRTAGGGAAKQNQKAKGKWQKFFAPAREAGGRS
jgi:hypothetical protein